MESNLNVKCKSNLNGKSEDPDTTSYQQAADGWRRTVFGCVVFSVCFVPAGPYQQQFSVS